MTITIIKYMVLTATYLYTSLWILISCIAFCLDVTAYILTIGKAQTKLMDWSLSKEWNLITILDKIIKEGQ